MVWAAGISSPHISEIPETSIDKSGRIIGTQFKEVNTLKDVYAIGDISLVKSQTAVNSHPQVAPVAIHQSKNWRIIYIKKIGGKPLLPF